MGIKVKGPADGGSFSWGGAVFIPNKKGIAEVPAEALGDLLPHGILPIDGSLPDQSDQSE